MNDDLKRRLAIAEENVNKEWAIYQANGGRVRYAEIHKDCPLDWWGNCKLYFKCKHYPESNKLWHTPVVDQQNIQKQF